LPHSFILSALSRIQPAFCLWEGLHSGWNRFSGMIRFFQRISLAEAAGLRKGIRSCAKLFWHLPLL
jgi:hypothetical protein